MSDNNPMPCPWCGEIGIVAASDTWYTPTDTFVRCRTEGCEAWGPSRETEEAAIAAWNRVALAVQLADAVDEYAILDSDASGRAMELALDAYRAAKAAAGGTP